MSKVYVVERLLMTVPRGSVDRANCTVRGVRILGPRSRNGRKYPPAVSARHHEMFRVGVNVGHHMDPATGMPLEVPPTDRFGRIIDTWPERDGISGTLRYNPEHSIAKRFLWACENDPHQFAFSPLMAVRWAMSPDADGDRVAESFVDVASVDLVSDGGIAESIWESLQPGQASVGRPAGAGSGGLRETIDKLAIGEPEEPFTQPPTRRVDVGKLVSGFNPDE